MFLAAGGCPSLGADRRGARRRRAGRRRRQHHQLLDRARPRPADAPHRATGRCRTGEIAPERARSCSASCSTCSRSRCSWSTVNLLSAALAVGATLFYVFVYTIWLKPRSPQNIVIGGAAGAVPVLVGWAAVTGDLAAPGVGAVRDRVLLDAAALLGAVAAVPRRLRGRRASRCSRWRRASRRGRARSWPTRSSWSRSRSRCRSPATSARSTSSPPRCSASLFVVQALPLARDPTPERAIRFFTFSNMYLALLFVAVAVDTLVRSV